MFSIQLHRFLTLAENKYNQLLTILILFFLGFPFVYFSRVIALILFLITTGGLLLINYRIRWAKQNLRIYVIAVACAIPIEIIIRFYSASSISTALFIIQTSLSLFILVSTVYAILQETSTAQTVTADTVRGGICIYLLLGMVWVDFYQLIYHFDSDAFQGLSITNSGGDLLYFSFVTLTTVGYGDISPLSVTARICANLEAIMGVMFLATFIARLVSLYDHNRM
jgi:Ion channel